MAISDIDPAAPSGIQIAMIADEFDAAGIACDSSATLASQAFRAGHRAALHALLGKLDGTKVAVTGETVQAFLAGHRIGVTSEDGLWTREAGK
jgi:hypothetical protein